MNRKSTIGFVVLYVVKLKSCICFYLIRLTRAMIVSMKIFFNNSCFKDLKLEGCIFNPSGVISWKSLKLLSITIGNSAEDLIENIIAGSPSLETMMLAACHGTWELGIMSGRIKKLVFSGCWYPDGEFDSQVNNLIRFATRCKVKELELKFYYDDYKAVFVLDEDCFIDSCFTDLNLSCCIFHPKRATSWKRLRSLYIKGCNLGEDAVENILSGCPLLENLVLDECYGLRRLCISSMSVKNLVLSRYRIHDRDDEISITVEINTPNILSLIIRSYLHLVKFLQLNVSSLVKANLELEIDEDYDITRLEEEKMLTGFIQSLHHVKELSIGGSSSKVLSRLVSKGAPYSIHYGESSDWN